MSEKVVKLSSPVTIAGKTTAELTLHEPKAKHLRGVKINLDGSLDMDMLLELAATLTGELPAVIDELSIADLAALGNAVIDFLPVGMRPAGKTP